MSFHLLQQPARIIPWPNFMHILCKVKSFKRWQFDWWTRNMFGSICKRTFTIRFKWHRQKTTFWTWQIFSFCTKKNMEVVWNCWNKKNTHTHISTNITEIVYKSKWMKKRQVWNLNKCFYGVKRNCRQVHTSKCIVLKLDRTFIFSNIEQFVTRSSTQKWNQPCWLCSSSFFFCLFSTCCFCFFFFVVFLDATQQTLLRHMAFFPFSFSNFAFDFPSRTIFAVCGSIYVLSVPISSGRVFCLTFV